MADINKLSTYEDSQIGIINLIDLFLLKLKYLLAGLIITVLPILLYLSYSDKIQTISLKTAPNFNINNIDISVGDENILSLNDEQLYEYFKKIVNERDKVNNEIYNNVKFIDDHILYTKVNTSTQDMYDELFKIINHIETEVSKNFKLELFSKLETKAYKLKETIDELNIEKEFYRKNQAYLVNSEIDRLKIELKIAEDSNIVDPQLSVIDGYKYQSKYDSIFNPLVSSLPSRSAGIGYFFGTKVIKAEIAILYMALNNIEKSKEFISRELEILKKEIELENIKKEEIINLQLEKTKILFFSYNSDDILIMPADSNKNMLLLIPMVFVLMHYIYFLYLYIKKTF